MNSRTPNQFQTNYRVTRSVHDPNENYLSLRSISRRAKMISSYKYGSKFDNMLDVKLMTDTRIFVK